MTNTLYKLHYFDARGRAEVARWILSYAGQKFEDIRVSSHEVWKNEKATTPFGQLPYLEVEQNGKVDLIGQSQAIGRYLARQHGLAGSNAIEEAQADGVVDWVSDAIKGLYEWIRAVKTNDPAKADTLRQEYTSNGAVPFLQKLESILETQQAGNSSTYFVGKQVTWADFTVAEFLDELVRLDANVLGAYPLLQSHNDHIHNLKGVKEWIAKRSETKF